MEAVAPYLKTVRLAAGLTQTEAADRVGISPKTVERWEAGKHEPPASELAVYVRAIGGEVERLLRLLVGSEEGRPFILSDRHQKILEGLSDEDLDLVISLAERMKRSQ